MSNFQQYTGAQRVYPTYGNLIVNNNDIVDFGLNAVPNDGFWSAHAGPATVVLNASVSLAIVPQMPVTSQVYYSGVGSPPSGSYPTGETAIDSVGNEYLCTAGGTPGTWISAQNATYAAQRALIPARGVAPTGPQPTYAFPTVTVSAANAATTLATGNQTIYAASNDANNILDTTHYVYSDSPPASAFFVPTGLGVYINSGQSAYNVASVTQGSFTVHIGYLGQHIELLLGGFGHKYRILVDGVPDPAGWRTEAADNELYRVLLDFTEFADRVISIQLPTGAFCGATIGPNDLIYKTALPKLPLCIVQGDSVGYGQNIQTDGFGSTELDTFPTWIGKQLGWNVYNESEGGTGFVNPGTSAGYAKAADRLATRVIPYAPDVVIAAFGLNDTTLVAGQTIAQTDTEIRSWYSHLKAALPNCVPIVVGPFFAVDRASDATDYNADLAVHDQQQTTCAALGITFITTVGWQTGKYGTAAGTAEAILGTDGIHPTIIGHKYYARRIVEGILTLLPKAGVL